MMVTRYLIWLYRNFMYGSTDKLRVYIFFFFVFKQKTAYDLRISDWSSDVCSSDLAQDRDAAASIDADPGPAIRPGRQGKAGIGGRGRRTGRSEERRVGNEYVRTCRSR